MAKSCKIIGKASLSHAYTVLGFNAFRPNSVGRPAVDYGKINWQAVPRNWQAVPKMMSNKAFLLDEFRPNRI